MMLWWVQQRSDPCRNEGTSSGMKEGCGVDMTMYSMVKGSALSWNATERVSVRITIGRARYSDNTYGKMGYVGKVKILWSLM